MSDAPYVRTLVLDIEATTPESADQLAEYLASTLVGNDYGERTVVRAGVGQREVIAHEYRELPDTVYPHLVNPQCICGWRMSGYVAGWLALRSFEKHTREGER